VSRQIGHRPNLTQIRRLSNLLAPGASIAQLSWHCPRRVCNLGSFIASPFQHVLIENCFRPPHTLKHDHGHVLLEQISQSILSVTATNEAVCRPAHGRRPSAWLTLASCLNHTVAHDSSGAAITKSRTWRSRVNRRLDLRFMCQYGFWYSLGSRISHPIQWTSAANTRCPSGYRDLVYHGWSCCFLEKH